MLADRDNSLPEAYLTELEGRGGGRLRFLPRLHVENYFLDEETLAVAFSNLVAENDWRRDPAAIRMRLLELARALIPVAVNRWLGMQLRSLVGEIDVSVKGAHAFDRDGLIAATIDVAKNESRRTGEFLGADHIASQINERWSNLEGSLEHGDLWKKLFPGKILFNQFASAGQLRPGFLRSAYLAASRNRGHACFSEVIEIFRSWAAPANQ